MIDLAAVWADANTPELLEMLLKYEWSLPFRLVISLVFFWKASKLAKSVADGGMTKQWTTKNLVSLGVYLLSAIGLLTSFFGLFVLGLIALFVSSLVWWNKHRPVVGQVYEFRRIGEVEVIDVKWVEKNDLIRIEHVYFKHRDGVEYSVPVLAFILQAE